MAELPDVDQAHQSTRANEALSSEAPSPPQSAPGTLSTAASTDDGTLVPDAPSAAGLPPLPSGGVSAQPGEQPTVEVARVLQPTGGLPWKQTLAGWASYLLAAAAGAALLGGAFYGWAVWQYGSTSKALARLRGQVLFLERDSTEIPTVPERTYHTGYWYLENLTSKPVTVVGSRSGCGCVVAEDLPISIGPRARQRIGISAIVTAPKEGDEFAQAIQLCLDTPSAPVVAVVRAKVLREGSQ